MTTGQEGYASRNRFAGFANNVAEDDVLDNDTAKTIATTINSHMPNLSAQTAASLKANGTQFNTPSNSSPLTMRRSINSNNC
jgi:hypothetical protein